MTVRELINCLIGMNPEAIVIYRCCSDWQVLEANDVEYLSKEKCEESFNQDTYSLEAITFRGGAYHSGYSRSMYGEESPVFHDVVTFPGN